VSTISGQFPNRLQCWALQLQARTGFNKAAIGLANKLARIAWATCRYQRDFNPDQATSAAA
jgi:transposase